MESVEWCSLRTAPVYPLRSLLRIASVNSTRPRRSIRRTIRSVFPWPLEDRTVRFLPRLRAVVVIPHTPATDLVGAPIPALTLERLMRQKGRLLPGRSHRRTAIVETAYGYDRYDIARSGLIRCTANVRLTAGAGNWNLPAGKRRERLTQRRSTKMNSFRWHDRIALVAAAIAIAIIAVPAPESLPTADALRNGAAIDGSPATDGWSDRTEPGSSAIARPGSRAMARPAAAWRSHQTVSGTPGVLPETFLVEMFPEGELSRVVRGGDRVVVTIVTPITDRLLRHSYPTAYPPTIDEFEIVRSGSELIVSAGWRLQ
jgi:hypothetical protein